MNKKATWNCTEIKLRIKNNKIIRKNSIEILVKLAWMLVVVAGAANCFIRIPPSELPDRQLNCNLLQFETI
jgi:hypothetical protein